MLDELGRVDVWEVASRAPLDMTLGSGRCRQDAGAPNITGSAGILPASRPQAGDRVEVVGASHR